MGRTALDPEGSCSSSDSRGTAGWTAGFGDGEGTDEGTLLGVRRALVVTCSFAVLLVFRGASSHRWLVDFPDSTSLIRGERSSRLDLDTGVSMGSDGLVRMGNRKNVLVDGRACFWNRTTSFGGDSLRRPVLIAGEL